jgi:hypothetical protein
VPAPAFVPPARVGAVCRHAASPARLIGEVDLDYVRQIRFRQVVLRLQATVLPPWHADWPPCSQAVGWQAGVSGWRQPLQPILSRSIRGAHPSVYPQLDPIARAYAQPACGALRRRQAKPNPIRRVLLLANRARVQEGGGDEQRQGKAMLETNERGRWTSADPFGVLATVDARP